MCVFLLCPPGPPSNTHTCQGSRTPETSGLSCSFSAFSSFFRGPFSVHVFCSILSPLNYSMSVTPVSSEVTVKNLVQPGRRGPSGRMTSDGSYSLKFLPWSWENFFSVRVYSTSQSVIEGKQGRNLERATEIEAIGECCSLAYPSWLTRLLSYTIQDYLIRSGITSVS